MALILVYNNAKNRMERYYREEWQAMPYNVGGTLKVREFRGASKSNILWTDRRSMNSWNTFRRFWGAPVFVGFAFKRIWEGGHTPQSQHYAGLAFDLGQTLTSAQRNRLRNAARNSGAWSYVEPAYLTPRWVHVDDRFGTPACSGGGFPALFIGSKGVYVLVLQDALNALGYRVGIDGNYGINTSNAVRNFQRAQGLARSGNVNCATWVRVTTLANGKG